MSSTPTAPSDLAHLDEQAFAALAEPHRRELRTHCYRMLGSLAEAEEAAQEALWRAWRRRDTYAGRGPFRAWLYKIATNFCLDVLKQRPRRSLPVARGPAASTEAPIPASLNEPIWLEPIPDDLLAPDDQHPEARSLARERISLAFLTAIHRLPPRQRAVLILREVLEWPAGEVAEALGLTVPAVKSALHRARATLAAHPPGQEAAPDSATPEHTALLSRYVRAWESADVEGLVALLSEEASFSMPPIPAWYQGREVIRRLVSRTVFAGQAAGRWRLLPTRANGQSAFGLYRLDEASGAYAAYGIQVLTFASNGLADITTCRNPALLPAFGLPTTL